MLRNICCMSPHVEPELSSLPESYFLEDITEGLKVSGDEACDGESPIQSFSSVHEVESIQ